MSRLIIILLVITSSVTLAQNPGYFGKYNVFTFKYLPGLDYSTEGRRAISVDEDVSLSEIGFLKDTDQSGIVTKTFNLEHMFQIGYARLIKRNIAVGANIGYTRLNLGQPNEYSNQNNLRGIESLQANTFSFEGYIEFAPNKAILMSSISHKFGLRYVGGSLRDKDYLGRRQLFGGTYETFEFPLEQITTVEDVQLSGLQFIYGITLHKPLTDFMVLQYGFNINLGPSLISKNNRLNNYQGELSNEPNPPHIIDPNFINFMFDRALFTNLVNADISLIFPF